MRDAGRKKETPDPERNGADGSRGGMQGVIRAGVLRTCPSPGDRTVMRWSGCMRSGKGPSSTTGASYGGEHCLLGSIAPAGAGHFFFRRDQEDHHVLAGGSSLRCVRDPGGGSSWARTSGRRTTISVQGHFREIISAAGILSPDPGGCVFRTASCAVPGSGAAAGAQIVCSRFWLWRSIGTAGITGEGPIPV